MGERASEVFMGIGLLTAADIRDQPAESPAYWKYMYHGVSIIWASMCTILVRGVSRWKREWC